MQRTPADERRRRRDRLWLGFVVLYALAAVVATISETGDGSASTPTPTRHRSSSLPGELTGPAPWVANTADLRARLQALGLPALAREGTVLHLHVHLDVYVDGRSVTVPAGIGIAEKETFFSPLHTHDDSGVIHVESPEVRVFTLGEFFGVWGVRFTPRCLGGYCARDGKRIRVFVDGERFAGDPAALALHEHDEIVVAYGTQSQLPNPIPSAYHFAAGL